MYRSTIFVAFLIANIAFAACHQYAEVNGVVRGKIIYYFSLHALYFIYSSSKLGRSSLKGQEELSD